ncbi:unnamed protein product, partial [Nesidiocoris tenuis]
MSHVFPDGREYPIAFASRSLTPSEQKYPQIEKEALGLVWALKKFFHYVYGREFILHTDHKPLTHIFNPQGEIPPMSATRLMHYSVFLLGFNYQIRFRKTGDHANADFCSRYPVSDRKDYRDESEIFQCSQLGRLPISRKDIAEETRKDPESKSMFEAIVEGRLKSNIHEYSIQDGCIFRGNRVFIPPSLRKEILSELHDGHLGVQKMKNLARSYVYWENIDADIAQLTKQCPACIRFAKAPNKIVHHWLPPEDSWQRIHVDHAGPFHGKYFLLIVDAYSKWIEVFIVPNLTTTSNLPYFREAFGRFGHPYVLVSDNHGCFASQEFAAFLAEMGSSMSSHPLSILHRTDRWR